MRRVIPYQPGDRIVLKARALGDTAPGEAATVVSVLPETRGSIAYRVRFADEKFDRHVEHDLIDAEASTMSAPVKPSGSETRGSSWVNFNSLRTKK